MSLISGNVTFNSGSINYSANANVIVGSSSFCADAQNCGLISSGYFFDTAINAGTISCNAVFAGTSVNSGTASIAVFSGNSINCSSVTTCAVFVDTAVNAGSVTYASFCASATNNGIVSQSGLFYGTSSNCGSVCGNAIFADTASNALGATVCGNADFSVTASNAGTVVGETGVYTPPSSNWYYDTSSAASAVTLNGTVTQSDEGSGVIAAEFGGGYLSTSLSDVSGDFTLDLFAKPTENSTYRPIISLGSYTNGILLRNSSNGAADNLYVNGSNLVYGNNSYLNQNVWNHIVLVRESNVFQIYVNGFSIASASESSTLDFSPTFIGSAVHNLNEVFSGKIAAIRLVVGSALYSGSTITIPTTLPTAVSGTELLLNFGASAVPTVTPHGDGAYSDGYYANGVIDTSYNLATPIQATDDSKYYTYNNGTSTLFNGAIEVGGPWYSVTAGVMETTATFTGVFNNGGTYLNINNGGNAGSLAEGTRILASNGLYYNFTGNGSLPANAFNGAIEIDGSWYSIVDGVKEATATFNGAGPGPFNGYFPIVNGSLNNGNYADGILISATDGLYYNFSQESGALPAPFNGAINIYGGLYWYSVVNGVREANATFNGFYQEGSGYMLIENGYQGVNPAVGVVKNIDGFYYYLSAVNTLVGLANGAYSSGYYLNGVLDTSFNTSGAGAQDNNKWYVYANGVATGYANGYTIQSGLTNTISINGTTYTNGTYDLVVDANGDGVGGNNQYASSGTEFYNDGSVYSYTSDGIGGYIQSYIASGTVLLGNQGNNINILGINYSNGTYDVVADGSGGTTTANYSYLTINTEFFNNGVDSYVSDGAGGYTVYYVNGYLIQNDVANTISINNNSYSNGTFDEVANGTGGSTFVYTYAASGTEFVSEGGISYQSDGNGGYTEVPV